MERSKNDFMFLHYVGNEIYTISEIYRALFNNEDEFKQYINRFVEKSNKNYIDEKYFCIYNFTSLCL